MGGGLRFLGGKFQSADYVYFLEPWYDAIKVGGLSNQVGDYNLPYQTIIWIFTKITSLDPIYAYKVCSGIFDFALALMCYWIYVKVYKGEVKKGVLLFGLIWCLPTVVLNSSYWAQCDSIYTFFLITSIYYFFKKNFVKGFVFWGVALSFKLQAIFLMPFIVVYYLKYKEFSVRKLIYTILGFYILCIPAILCGRKIFDPIKIYLYQTVEYKKMYLNFPSFWSCFSNLDYNVWAKFAIAVTVIVLGIGAYLLLMDETRTATFENIFSFLVWFTWTTVLFLPAMHERYGYFLDIILCIAVFIDKKYFKYAIITCLVSFICYLKYLVGSYESISIYYLGLIYTIAWAAFTYQCYKKEDDTVVF